MHFINQYLNKLGELSKCCFYSYTIFVFCIQERQELGISTLHKERSKVFSTAAIGNSYALTLPTYIIIASTISYFWSPSSNVMKVYISIKFYTISSMSLIHGCKCPLMIIFSDDLFHSWKGFYVECHHFYRGWYIVPYIIDMVQQCSK